MKVHLKKGQVGIGFKDIAAHLVFFFFWKENGGQYVFLTYQE
jgi:hypothetical protein